LLAFAFASAVHAQNGTEELAYELIDNGRAYSVSKGTVKDGAVIIPAVYNGLPVTTIGERAFFMAQITSITIPNSVTSIEKGAFEDCEELTSIIIPNSVKTIGEGAFDYCAKLVSVTIGNGVTSIKQSAFYECTVLQA